MVVSSVAILHYSAPPVIGGVESVMSAHARLLLGAGSRVCVFAGRGDGRGLPHGTEFRLIPEMDSKNADIVEINRVLEQGAVPAQFDAAVALLVDRLRAELPLFDKVIVHNIFTKHFNLPLTVALDRLLRDGVLPGCIAWCHDFSWTSPTSRSKVFAGFPWDLLRNPAPSTSYVVVSKRRQSALADLLGVRLETIRVVYNGVWPDRVLGLSDEGAALTERLRLSDAELIVLMPVRVTRAKNIEFAMHVTAELKRRRPGVRLVITGPPDPHSADSMAYFDSLRALRAGLNLRDEIRFVYENGPSGDAGFVVQENVVGDLYRLADVMFMPSHREGFGMPVLEAGLVGIPVVTANIPSAEEVGDTDVTIVDIAAPPATVAAEILRVVEDNPVATFRRRVRSSYTWPRVFQRSILPLLNGQSEAGTW